MAAKKNYTPNHYTVLAAANQEEQREQDKQLLFASSRDQKSKPWQGLDLWPDDVAGLPSELTRTALFGLPRKGRRKFRKNELIFSAGDIQVRYYGHQLDQGDLEVWLLLLMVAQGQDEDQLLRMRLAPMLRTLKRNDKGNSRKGLISSLERLAISAFHIVYVRNGHERRGVFHFLEGVAIDTETKEVVTQVGKQLHKLYSAGFTSLMDFDRHVTLPSNMAKAIHKYAVGQKRGANHYVHLYQLQRLLGYEGEMKRFKPALLKGLDQLEFEGILESPRITQDNVVRWKMTKI